MPTVSIPRDRIADGSLPSVCAVCGKDAPHRLFPGVSSPSLAWVLLSPLLGIVAFWGYILMGGGTRRDQAAGLPFCDRHRSYWPRRGWFVVVGFLGLIGTLVVAGAIAPPPAPGKQAEPHWLFGVAGCWLLVYLPTFLIVHLSAMRPTAGDRTSLVLSGASRAFASAVESQSEADAAADRGDI